MIWVLFIALAGWPLIAVASGTTVQDAFEGPTLLTTDNPPGVWDHFDLGYLDSGVALTPSAAHSGNEGLRVTDADPQSDGGTEVDLAFYLSPLYTGDYYARSWVRLSSSNDVGNMVIVSFESTLNAGDSVCDLSLEFPGGALFIEGASVGAFQSVDAGVALTPGSWHLLECGALGIGTDAGMRVAWVDGVEVDRQPLDFSGVQLKEFLVGEPYSSDRRFVGSLDFDDVRTSTTPLASTIVLDGGAVPRATSRCVPIAVSLWASGGTPAPAVSSLSLSLDAGSGVRLFEDPGCVTPGDQVGLDAGDFGAAFGAVADTPGTALISATHPDFLSGSASLTFVGGPDAGADGGAVDGGAVDSGSADAGHRPARGPFDVGCGCGTAPGPLGVLLLVTFGFRRRGCRQR